MEAWKRGSYLDPKKKWNTARQGFGTRRISSPGTFRRCGVSDSDSKPHPEAGHDGFRGHKKKVWITGLCQLCDYIEGGRRKNLAHRVLAMNRGREGEDAVRAHSGAGGNLRAVPEKQVSNACRRFWRTLQGLIALSIETEFERAHRESPEGAIKIFEAT